MRRLVRSVLRWLVKAVELFASESLTIGLAGIYALERMLAEFRGEAELAPLVELLCVCSRANLRRSSAQSVLT